VASSVTAQEPRQGKGGVRTWRLRNRVTELKPLAEQRAVQGCGGHRKNHYRKHGGAKGAGGPRGVANGNYQYGQYTQEMLAGRKVWKASARWLDRWRREIEHEEKGESVEINVILGTDHFRR